MNKDTNGPVKIKQRPTQPRAWVQIWDEPRASELKCGMKNVASMVCSFGSEFLSYSHEEFHERQLPLCPAEADACTPNRQPS